jgi:uridine kinase
MNTKLVLRDVKERGRDIDGIIKQWFTFVKPSYKKYIEPQRSVSGKIDTVRLPQDCRQLVLTANLDIIIPRGIENKTAIGKVCIHII